MVAFNSSLKQYCVSSLNIVAHVFCLICSDKLPLELKTNYLLEL